MKRVSLCLSVLLFSALPVGLAAAGAASAAAATSRPALTATTVLTGTASAVSDVRLAKPATFRQPQLDPKGGAVQVSGKGRFLGLALIEQTDDDDRTVIIGGRVETADGPVMTSSALSTRHGGLDPVWTLPAGDYKLYLLTDGSPAKVTLRLGGVTGSSALKPTQKVAHTVKQPANQLLEEVVASAGGNAVTRGSALTFGHIVAKNDPGIVYDGRSCSYYSPQPDQFSKFRPGCIGSENGSGLNFINANTGPLKLVATSFGLDLRSGDHGQGYSITTVGDRASLDYTAIWLDLTPLPAAKTATPPKTAPTAPGTMASSPPRRTTQGPARSGPAGLSAPEAAANASLPATGPGALYALAPALLAAAGLAGRMARR